MFVWQNDIASKWYRFNIYQSLKFGACYIMTQWDEFRIKNAFLTFYVLFHHKICIFIIFNSFFDEVSNFQQRILRNRNKYQKQLLVVQNCQWNCMVIGNFEYSKTGKIYGTFSCLIKSCKRRKSVKEPPEMFYEKRSVTLLKRDSSTGVFLWILGNFLITSFEEHLRKTASEKSVHEPSGSLFLI